MKISLLAGLFCAGVSISPAQGQMPAHATECSLPDVASAWLNRAGSLPLLTDTVAAEITGRTGASYHVALQPCAGRHCEAGTWAGLFPVAIPADGRYRVAVSDTAVWLDVITTAGKVEGVLCEHAGCAPIRKIVQFDLKAGPHWVQLISRKPALEADFLVMPLAGRDTPLFDKKP